MSHGEVVVRTYFPDLRASGYIFRLLSPPLVAKILPTIVVPFDSLGQHSTRLEGKQIMPYSL
jgi:hypothetical protein